MSRTIAWVRVAAEALPVPPPPMTGLACDHLLDPIPAEGVVGQLRDWRWVDQDAGQWVGFVTYNRGPGMSYAAWIPGTKLARMPDVDVDAWLDAKRDAAIAGGRRDDVRQ